MVAYHMHSKTFLSVSRCCDLNIISFRQDLEWNKKTKSLSATDVIFIRMNFKSTKPKGGVLLINIFISNAL